MQRSSIARRLFQQTKVFIGSLPLGSKPEELRRLFERYGVVTECDVMNRCGFVHMQSEEMASNAIHALNNTSFNGGVITVERGRIKERGRGGARGGPRGPAGPRRGPSGAGGPMRGPGGPPVRDSPYMRDRPPMDMGGRPGPMGPGPMGPPRNGAPYDRQGRAPYDERLGGPPPGPQGPGFSGEDRRGFALMGGYGGGMGGYGDDRRGGYPNDDRRGCGMFGDERRGGGGGGGGMFGDDRPNMMMDRRGGGGGGGMRPPMSMPSFDRGAPRGPAPMGNGDIFSRRSPPQM